MVEAALAAPTSQHDDGSASGMYDLVSRLPDGTSAAIEVTAAADRDCIELWNLMNGDGGRWIAADIEGGWMVSLRPTARARRLRKELPPLLKRLEDAGIPGFRHPRAGRSELEEVASRLGIVSAYQGGTEYPGSIYVTIEDDVDRRAGWISSSPNVTSRWIGEFLASAELNDVRSKLRRADADQRHAFVILPGFTTAPFGVTNLLMGYGGAPLEDPELPEPITHAWMVSTWSVGTGWRWSPGEGWLPFEKLLERDATHG